MARLRLIAVAALAAGCGQAGAQVAPVTTNSGLAVPAEWTAQPAMATKIADAARADGGTVTGSEAWAEPARGCYAAWLSLAGADANADLILASLAKITGLSTSDIVKPNGFGDVTLKFAAAPYAGRLRAKIDKTGVTALACFANAREPLSCEAPCAALLGGVK